MMIKYNVRKINILITRKFNLSIVCCVIILYFIGYIFAILTWGVARVFNKPLLYFNFHFEIINIFILVYSLKQFLNMAPREDSIMLSMAKKYIFDPTLKEMKNVKKILIIYLLLLGILFVGYYLAKFESAFLISYFHLILICISLLIGSIEIIGWWSLICNIKRYGNKIDFDFIKKYGKDIVLENKMGLSTLERPILKLLLLVSVEILCVVFLIIYQLNTHYPAWFVEIRPLILFLLVSILTGIFIFTPIYYAHEVMKKIRDAVLDNINQRWKPVAKQIINGKRITLNKHNNKYQEYQYLLEIKREIEKLSTWPIDIPVWVKWLISTVIINIVIEYFITKYSYYISQMP